MDIFIVSPDEGGTITSIYFSFGSRREINLAAPDLKSGGGPVEATKETT
jgi:hypothetical protein